MALTKAQKASVDARIKAAKARRAPKKKTAKRRRVKTARAAPASRKKAKRKTSGPGRVVQPSMSSADMALASTYNYARALSDPFNAPLNTGIPMAQLGLGTFKTTRHFRAVIDTVASTGSQTVGNTVFGSISHALRLNLMYTADGRLFFQYGTGGTLLPTVNLGTFPTVPVGRLVCAAIRVTRIGRKDDAGLRYGIERTCQDGVESYPGFTSSDFMQVNYIPKTAFDCDYKLNITGHPTQFDTKIDFAVAGMLTTSSTFQVDFRAIIESNHDTPPANVYTQSDWLITHNGHTRNADTNMLPEQLASISRAAAMGRFVPVSPGHQDHSTQPTEMPHFRPGPPQLREVGIQGTPSTSSIFSYESALDGFNKAIARAETMTDVITDVNGKVVQYQDTVRDLTNAWQFTKILMGWGAVGAAALAAPNI